MAASVGPSRGVIAGINVTPMADVMIVLLVIFLVVTPLIDDDPGLVLPPARHGASDPPAAPAVSLRRDGRLALEGESLTSLTELEVRLGPILASRPEGQRNVLLEADRQLRYADVGPILERCRAAGAEQVALRVSVGNQGS